MRGFARQRAKPLLFVEVINHMNIQSLLEKVALFEEIVLDSGFMRDTTEYLTAVGQPDTQNNLIALKTIAKATVEGLQKIEDGPLSEEMNLLLPGEENFTDTNHIEELNEILSDPTIETTTFHSKLTNILSNLTSQIKTDFNKIKKLKDTFSVYVNEEQEWITEKNEALVSLLFRDKYSTHNLKNFASVISRWDRTLQTYHKLLKSESPQETPLVQIQEGSIDVVVNLNFDVAINLAELVKTGLLIYASYLTYKSKLPELMRLISGNARMKKLQEEMSKEYLANIKKAVRKELVAQHSEEYVAIAKERLKPYLDILDFAATG